MILQPGERFSFNKNTFFYASLILAVITIPLQNNLNSYAIVLFSVTAFFQSPFKDNIRKLKNNSYWLISILFFLSLLISYLWNSPGSFSFRHIQVYASFLALPLICIVAPKLSEQRIKWLCYSFVGITSLVCLICLIKAYDQYQITGNSDFFFYHSLAGEMGLNAIYLSNYCLASLYWLLYFQVIRKSNLSRLSAILVYLFCFYLFCFIILLSSKLIIMMMAISLLLFCLYAGLHKKGILPIILFVIIISATLGLVLNIPFLRERIAVTEIKMYSSNKDDGNGFAGRLLMWQCGLELIKERPVMGYGMEKSKEELVNKYKEIKWFPGITEKYNTHNQYLETTLNGGIVAFTLFMLLTLIPLIAGIKRRDFLVVTIIIQFLLESMVEAPLTVQQQVVFFWLFIWIFYYNNLSSNGNENKRSNHYLQ